MVPTGLLRGKLKASSDGSAEWSDVMKRQLVAGGAALPHAYYTSLSNNTTSNSYSASDLMGGST